MKLERWSRVPDELGTTRRVMDSQRRVYIVDADEDDAKRCENCAHWRLVVGVKGWCSKLDGGDSVTTDFYCKYFEARK